MAGGVRRRRTEGGEVLMGHKGEFGFYRKGNGETRRILSRKQQDGIGTKASGWNPSGRPTGQRL